MQALLYVYSGACVNAVISPWAAWRRNRSLSPLWPDPQFAISRRGLPPSNYLAPFLTHPPLSHVSCEQLSEERLRKVCQLVSDESDFDSEMDFKELKTAARQLLQQPGNMIRFQKSVAQLEAKARWSEMDADAKAPYEAKYQADQVRWREWQEAEAGLKSASGSGGGGAASGGGADAKPP